MVQNVFTETSFTNMLDKWAGRQVTHVAITKATSNITGQESLTEGTASTIDIYFVRTNKQYDYDKAGLKEVGDAIALVPYSDSVGVNDLICSEGTAFTISAIDGNATTISITTSASHSLAVGDIILIQNTTNYEGRYTVATVPTGTTLTIADTNHDLAAESSGKLISDFSDFRIEEALNVSGVFETGGTGTDFVYTACSLFLWEQK